MLVRSFVIGCLLVSSLHAFNEKKVCVEVHQNDEHCVYCFGLDELDPKCAFEFTQDHKTEHKSLDEIGQSGQFEEIIEGCWKGSSPLVHKYNTFEFTYARQHYAIKLPPCYFVERMGIFSEDSISGRTSSGSCSIPTPSSPQAKSDEDIFPSSSPDVSTDFSDENAESSSPRDVDLSNSNTSDSDDTHRSMPVGGLDELDELTLNSDIMNQPAPEPTAEWQLKMASYIAPVFLKYIQWKISLSQWWNGSRNEA